MSHHAALERRGLLRQEGDPGPELCRRDLARVASAEQHRSRVGLEEGRKRARKRALAAARGTLDGDGLAGPYQDRRAVQDPATLAHHHELSRLQRRSHFADAAVNGSVVMPEPYRSARLAIGWVRPAPSSYRRTPTTAERGLCRIEEQRAQRTLHHARSFRN